MNIKIILATLGISCCMSVYAAQAMEETKEDCDATGTIVKSNPFDHIDDTVGVKIFGRFTASDLGRCAQVSKQWKALSSDEWVWKKVAKHYELSGRHFIPREIISWSEVKVHTPYPDFNWRTALWKDIVTTSITYWKDFREGRKTSQPIVEFTHRTFRNIEEEKKIYQIEKTLGRPLSETEAWALKNPDLAQVFMVTYKALSDEQREGLGNPTFEEFIEKMRDEITESCTIL